MAVGQPRVRSRADVGFTTAARGQTRPAEASAAVLDGALGSRDGRLVSGRAGWEVSWGFAPPALQGLGQPTFETFRPQGEGPGACVDTPPRLLGLYLTSAAGTPAACVERPGFSDDPSSVSAMLSVVADLVRDAFSPHGAAQDGSILRAASGTRGFCALRSRSFGLVAAIEGRQTEAFLADLRRLASLLESSLGETLPSWDGNPDAVKSAEAGLRAFLNCPEYGGADRFGNGDRVGSGDGIGASLTLCGSEVGRPFAGSVSGRWEADHVWQGLDGRVAQAERGPFFSDPDAADGGFLLSCGGSNGSVEARAYPHDVAVPGSTPREVDSRNGGACGPRRGEPSAEWAAAFPRLDPAGRKEARPPRVLALYLMAATGMPAARVEREGLTEDPDAVGMMVNVVVDYVRDALSTRGASFEGGILRAASGARGLCALPSRSFGLVAAIEGSETEPFLADLGRLAASLEQSVGETLQSWDGNLDSMRTAEAGLRNFLFCGKYEGGDLCQVGAGPEPFSSSVAWVTDTAVPVFAPPTAAGGLSYSTSIRKDELALGRGPRSWQSSTFPSGFSPTGAPESVAGRPRFAHPVAGSWSWSLSIDALSWGHQPELVRGRASNLPDLAPASAIRPDPTGLQWFPEGSLD